TDEVGEFRKGSTPMTPLTTLLVARDPTVINDVQQLHDETEDARLEVCGRLDKVLARVGHRALLIHLEAGADPAEVLAVLVAAGQAARTTGRPLEVGGVLSGSTAGATDLGPSPAFRPPAHPPPP